jgi:SRSO17 transposase
VTIAATGLPLVTTDLESTAEDLVARNAARWGIEQAFADARQILGVGQARNRTRRAVERTVPFGRNQSDPRLTCGVSVLVSGV